MSTYLHNLLYNSEPREGLPRLDKTKYMYSILVRCPCVPSVRAESAPGPLGLPTCFWFRHQHLDDNGGLDGCLWTDQDQLWLDFSPSCWSGKRSSCPRVCVISISFAYVNRPRLWLGGCTERGRRLVIIEPIGARRPACPAPSDTLPREKLHGQSTGCGRCFADHTLHVPHISCFLDRQSCWIHRGTKEEERPAAASCGTVGDFHHHHHTPTKQERLGVLLA